MRNKHSWSDKEIDELKRLVESGINTREIAEQHSRKPTRNAVAGMCHRMNLKIVRDHEKDREKQKETAARIKLTRVQSVGGATGRAIKNNIIRETLRRTEQKLVGPGGLNIMELNENSCRWLLPNGNYCGQHRDKFQSAWCDDHRKVARGAPKVADSSGRPPGYRPSGLAIRG